MTGYGSSTISGKPKGFEHTVTNKGHAEVVSAEELHYGFAKAVVAGSSMQEWYSSFPYGSVLCSFTTSAFKQQYALANPTADTYLVIDRTANPEAAKYAPRYSWFGSGFDTVSGYTYSSDDEAASRAFVNDMISFYDYGVTTLSGSSGQEIGKYTDAVVINIPDMYNWLKSYLSTHQYVQEIYIRLKDVIYDDWSEGSVDVGVSFDLQIEIDELDL